MQLNLDYQDAIILRNKGVDALKQQLGEEDARKFLALFKYYDVSDVSRELLVKDYTEWRRTQSWYNDFDMDDVIDYFKEHPERAWHRNENGDKVYDV